MKFIIRLQNYTLVPQPSILIYNHTIVHNILKKILCLDLFIYLFILHI